MSSQIFFFFNFSINYIVLAYLKKKIIKIKIDISIFSDIPKIRKRTLYKLHMINIDYRVYTVSYLPIYTNKVS